MSETISPEAQESAKQLHDAVNMAEKAGVEGEYNFGSKSTFTKAGDTVVQHAYDGTEIKRVELYTPRKVYVAGHQTTDEEGNVTHSRDINNEVVWVQRFGQPERELTGSRAEKASLILRKRAARNLMNAVLEKTAGT